MSLSNLGKRLNGYVNNVERDYRYALETMATDIERESVEIIQHAIMSTRSGLSPNKPNRYLSGAMHDNAKSRVSRAGNNYKIEYGWFGFTNQDNPGDYVADQELGGGEVEFGMHSFHAVQRRVRDVLHDYQKGKYFGYF